MLDGRNLRYVGQHEHRTNCAIEWARNGVCLWFWGIGGWIGRGGSDQGGQATEAEEEGRGQHRDEGICDGTFLLAVRYTGSVVDDDVDGGGKKATGDISWGKIVEERENRMIIIRIIRTCLSTTKLYVGTSTIPT